MHIKASVLFLGIFAFTALGVAAQHGLEHLVAVTNLDWITFLGSLYSGNLNGSSVPCVGTLVKDSYVLTSATCADSVEVGNVVITAEDIYAYFDVITLKTITKKIPHGNPDINNVALLKLNKKVSFTIDETVWRQNRPGINTLCFSPSYSYAALFMEEKVSRTISACNDGVYNNAHICAVGEEFEEREGSILVCDDLVAGIYSAILNPDNTTLVKYQEISTYHEWITVVSAASYVNMSFTAFLSMAVIVAVTAF